MVRFGRRARRIKWANTLGFFAVVIGIAYLGLTLSLFTGFLVSTESFYTSSGFQTRQPGEFVWSPEQQGLLTSVKLTGYIEGGGAVKVFLRSGERTFLVLDSSLLPGMNLTASEGQEVNEATPPVENLTANGGGGITASIIEDASQNLTQENITEGNLTMNGTVTPGILENQTSNETGSESQENATENVTIPPESPENPTMQNETIPVLRFEDACVETCSLPELNESVYTLAFEIEDGTVLYVESIRYSVLRYEKPANLPPAGHVPDQTVEAGQTLTINLSSYFSDPEDDPLSFAVDSPLNSSIDVDTLSVTPSQEGNFTTTVSASDGISMVFSSFWVFVLSSNITELNATNETETAPSTVFCSGCPDCSEKLRSSPPGSIILLDSDISGSGNCIEFSGAFDLTLDCRGHRITGEGSGCGILLAGSRENLLKNCMIEGFHAGVYLDRLSRGNVLVSLGVSGNAYGISLFSSTSNALEAIEGRIRVSSSSRNAISCI
jgi:hypothetical protein